MIHLSRNCRGMAAAKTINELKDICKAYKSSIIFLMETHAPRGRVERLKYDRSYVDLEEFQAAFIYYGSRRLTFRCWQLLLTTFILLFGLKMEITNVNVLLFMEIRLSRK